MQNDILYGRFKRKYIKAGKEPAHNNHRGRRCQPQRQHDTCEANGRKSKTGRSRLCKIPDVCSGKAGLPFCPESRISEENDRSGRVAASDVTEAGIDAGGFYKTAGVL